MTRAPYVLPKSDAPFGRRQELFDTVLGWRMINPKMPPQWTISLGETAENVAERYGITREEQDAFALESQMRCKARRSRSGRFARRTRSGARRGDEERRRTSVIADEHPRPKRRSNRSAHSSRHSGPMVRSPRETRRASTTAPPRCCSARPMRHDGFGMKPLARVVACASAGVAPDVMGLGPIPAGTKSAGASGIDGLGDLDLVELNEAFASQAHRLHARVRVSIRPRPTSTAARSRSVIRSEPAARGSRRRCCTSCAAAADATAWRRCASASGKASQRSSNEWSKRVTTMTTTARPAPARTHS